MTDYRHDLHAWSREQADAVRRRSANELDWDNLAEEIDSLGSQQQWELYNRLVVLLSHLLKWRFQPAHRSRSWRSTIAVQRRDLGKLIQRNPSLKASLQEQFEEAYPSARLQASVETGLAPEAFPSEPPFTADEAMSDSLPQDTPPHT